MINKEKLLKINDLNPSAQIDKMNDSQFAEYCKTLDAFVEIFPAYEGDLKSYFDAKDYDAFSQSLLAIHDVLTGIRANVLAQNSLKLLTDIRTAKPEILEAYLTYFLTSVSALSIDIQMAQHEEANEPVAKTEPGGVTEEKRAEEKNEEEVRQKIILAVDDVAFLLTMLKSVLFGTEYKFTGVTSGEAALRFIKKHTPDLFILDIEMPEMNGYELAGEIRARGFTAPIIFLTGNSTKEYVLKAIQAGAADFIIKPINKELVLEKVKRFIG